MEKELNEQERQKVEAEFAHGTADFRREDVDKLLQDEATAQRKGRNLKEAFKDFTLLYHLLKDYAQNNYTTAPWKLITAVGFAVAYLISPIDVIPDILPGGFIDDAGVFAIVMRAFQMDIDAYRAWREKAPAPAINAVAPVEE